MFYLKKYSFSSFIIISKLKLRKFATICSKNYNVIIIGGGHAGCEACTAATRMGAKTLLITHKKTTIGAMSCNPSFGGIGKGHLIKEIDALEGICGRICDLSGVHYKVLNKGKGPAVWGYRAQIDRSFYKEEMQKELFNTSNLDIIEASVEDLILENNKENYVSRNDTGVTKCIGVLLSDGMEILCDSVILSTGTFLRGSINVGLDSRPAGRMGDKPAIGLSNSLEKLNFKLGRLKTGTPPRIVKSTIDFSVCFAQQPDNPPRPFSFLNDTVKIKPENQLNCHLTHTTEHIENIVKESLHLNRHVQEEIRGPRYCPSIESKVLRYPNREHQVWLEPEGLDSPLIYPQGISCTMPLDFQQKLVRSLPGLQACEIAQPGYGVEYDYVNPQELTAELETKKIQGLYFAGQINGTTGYEEAAAQGLIAGINAAASSLRKPRLILDRTESYIGLLIDDLITQGVSEPYRMFTSRSEFRFSLRPDNADIRLTEKGYQIGCVSNKRYEKTKEICSKLEHWIGIMKSDLRRYSKWADLFNQHATKKFDEEKSAFDILGLVNWNISTKNLAEIDPFYSKLLEENDNLFERLKIQAIYAHALSLEQHLLDNMRRDYSLEIPNDIDYNDPKLNISNEAREKLYQIRPSTIGSASMIPGVTPVGISALLAFVKIKRKKYNDII